MTSKKKFDLAVIGAGPGGYVAAIKAAQFGLKVALIEKNFIGGTCLNVGCIPTKALISSGVRLEEIKQADRLGIVAKDVHFDFAKIMERKNKVVSQLRQSLEGLIKSNKIEIIVGEASFISSNELKVVGIPSFVIEAENIIIAVGSAPREIKAFPTDGKIIHNSTTILELKQLPKSLTVIGGGYIGCEFASLFLSLGVDVSIVESLDSLVIQNEPAICEELTSIFKKKGMKIYTSCQVKNVQTKNNGAHIELSNGETIDSEIVLVSVGRQFVAESLNLQKAGVQVNEHGAIIVNSQMQTNIVGIYAIGDATGKWMLAHFASHAGIVAAYNIAGHIKQLHTNAVPSVIFTHPEIASVGLTEKLAREEGYDYKVTKYPFRALGKALASDQLEGFAMLITDNKTGQILGAHLIGTGADNLIAEMALAIENELTIECLIETIHAHPTLAEVWMEAGMVANGTPLHFAPIRR